MKGKRSKEEEQEVGRAFGQCSANDLKIDLSAGYDDLELDQSSSRQESDSGSIYIMTRYMVGRSLEPQEVFCCG